MKSVSVIVAAVLLGCAATAQAQGAQAPPPDCQKLKAAFGGLDFGPVAASCGLLQGTPAPDACDTCAAALFTVFAPALAKIGYTCDNFPTDSAALTNAITPCVNVVLPILQTHGVNVNNLLALRDCPRTAGPKVQGVATKLCPPGTAVAAQTRG